MAKKQFHRVMKPTRQKRRPVKMTSQQGKTDRESNERRPIVVIRTKDETLAELYNGPFDATVKLWSALLEGRRHWAGGVETRNQQAGRAHEELGHYGLEHEALDRIARAGHVEVSIDGSGGELQTFARRVPWEYLLSAATADRRKGVSLMISRQLAGMRSAIARNPSSLLFIESAPGRFRRLLDFTSERKIVMGAFDFPQSGIQIAESESEESLKARFQTRADVVHFTGFDAHQGAALSSGALEDDPSVDGIVLRGSRNQPVIVEARQFASDLKSKTHGPVLVSFNCYYSSANLASYAVLEGAEAAIGFQDEIDDELAEFFFGAFYREWRLNEWDIHRAFSAAWRSLRGNIPYLHGTGIVLWTARSAFEETREQRVLQRASAQKAEVKLTADEQMLVDPKIVSEINYSLLHNEQPIFRSFLITRVKDGPPLQVDVTVELNVGMDSYPFRATEILNHEPLRLTDKVRIPLTSSLARSLRERVQSTLYVRVEVSKEVIYQQTTRVTLLPVDEWSDDDQRPSERDSADKRSVWLPSFVLPRDPSVARTIDFAQRYLMALQDDPGAGFDGYQQVDANDPATLSAVDQQVRAIWCALSYEWDLSYINPPPSYSLRTQRLRTPSDVLGGKRGTCIDLALLLAACLEYIDVYPTLILLKGHAFPAYWRSDTAHGKFVLTGPGGRTVTATPTSALPIPATEASRGGSRYSWVFDKRQFSELMQCIQRGDLVPLETVWLTNHNGFEAARVAGLQNLRNPREFDSMLDIIQARSNLPPVTPLPIIQGEN